MNRHEHKYNITFKGAVWDCSPNLLSRNTRLSTQRAVTYANTRFERMTVGYLRPDVSIAEKQNITVIQLRLQN